MASRQHSTNPMDNIEVYKDHDLELHDSSKDDSHDSSNDETHDSSNAESNDSFIDESHDPCNDDNSQIIQVPDVSLPGLYSSCQIEIARLSLMDDVNDDKGEKWYRLKYKLGMLRDNKNTDSIRKEMRNCMFDVHSSKWCQIPLIASCGTINMPSFQMNSEDNTSSAKDKPVDEGSESSLVISNEKTNSDAVKSESDDAIKESDNCSLKKLNRFKEYQQGYEEAEIDFNSELGYLDLASLYLN